MASSNPHLVNSRQICINFKLVCSKWCWGLKSSPCFCLQAKYISNGCLARNPSIHQILDHSNLLRKKQHFPTIRSSQGSQISEYCTIFTLGSYLVQCIDRIFQKMNKPWPPSCTYRPGFSCVCLVCTLGLSGRWLQLSDFPYSPGPLHCWSLCQLAVLP